mgnify:FL=1
MKKDEERPAVAIFLIALMVFQGMSGVFGGAGLVIDPTGNMMRMPLRWLEGSPFGNYLVPGIILLLVLGVFPLVVSWYLRKPSRNAWLGALITAGGLLVWLAVQVSIIGYQPRPPLQLIYAVEALLILASALIPRVRKYYN